MRQRTASLIGLLLVACGGTRATAPAPKSEAAPAAAATADPAIPKPTPVQAPPELVGVARLRGPARTLDIVSDWANVPLDWRKLLEAQAPGVFGVVSFDAPIEALATLGGGGRRSSQPQGVFSVGLSSVHAARRFALAQGLDAEPILPNVFRVGRLFGAPCVVAPALGSAAGRLVCGDNRSTLDTLLAPATRWLPEQELPEADLLVELYAEPIRQRYGKQLAQLSALAPFAIRYLGLDHPRFDRALVDVMHAAGEEARDILADLDKLALAATLNESAQTLEVDTSIALKGERSWFAQFTKAVEAAGAEAPELFWELPRDAAMAGYDAGLTPRMRELSVPMRAALTALLDGFLEHHATPKSLREDLTRLLALAFEQQGARVSAQDASMSTGDFLGADRRIACPTGWRLHAQLGPNTPWREGLKVATRILNHPSTSKLLSSLPNVQSARLKAFSKAAPALAKGAEQFEFRAQVKATEAADGEAKELDCSIFFALVPKGGTTWVLQASSGALLRERTQLLLKPEATLASHPGLGALKQRRVFSGAFLTIEALAKSAQSGGGPASAQPVLRALGSQANLPVFVFVEARSQAPASSLHIQLSAPRATLSAASAAVAGSLF